MYPKYNKEICTEGKEWKAVKVRKVKTGYWIKFEKKKK